MRCFASDPDPFAPDEMAQHRTPEHCPMCLERKPCACDAEADALEAALTVLPEESPAEPGLSGVVDVVDEPDLWDDRKDLT